MCDLMKSSSNVLGPTLGFMQDVEHIQFLEYLVGMNIKWVGTQMAEEQLLMSSKV